MQERVTREKLDEWLEKNRPHLASYENKMNGDKGVYRKDTGPAHSFKCYGKTWRAVLMGLDCD